MNEYLASPVTPIVISVLAIAISIGVIITIRSKRKKMRKEQESRRMEIRVAQQLAAELAAKEKKAKAGLEQQRSRTIRGLESAREKLRGKPSAPGRPRTGNASTTTYGESRRYDPSTDHLMNGMLIGGMFAADTDGGRDDNSSRDSGSSHGNGGSSSGSGWGSDSGGGGSYGGGGSSGDSGSGSSGGGGDSGGGGGGGCD